MASTRVLLVDDHRTLTDLLTRALDREPDLVTVGCAHSCAEGVAMARRHEPDAVVMDLRLPDGDGFAATRSIVAHRPATRVVILTAQADADSVARAAAAGASGLLAKDGSLDGLLRVLRGQGGFALQPSVLAELTAPPREREPGPGVPALTARERDVLELLGEGADVQAIASRLGISTSTCRGYVKSLLMKLGAHTQLEAVVLAVRCGLLRLDAP